MITSDFRAGQAGAGVRHLVNFWLDVVFPPACANCGRAGWLLCPGCAGQMAPMPREICSHCGRHLEMGLAAWRPQETCADCQANPSAVVQRRAPLRYQEPTSSIIHRFKYEGYFALGEPLARFMIDGWPAWQQPPDLILPIPLHSRRRRRRGYNQSELLARFLARAVVIPFEPTALRRDRHTVPQVGLGSDERHENVRGAFSAAAEIVSGRHVLLVDDVLTTGATMTAAAEALLAAGAATVAGYCLARVS